MSDSTIDLAGRLEPRSPRRVLEALAPIARALAASGRPRPEVELVLASGAIMRGRFIAIGDDPDGVNVLLATGGTAREPSVAHLRIDHVVGVVVGDASLLVHGPTFAEVVPSKLDLARQISAKSDSLAIELGRAMPFTLLPGVLDDDDRRAVAVVLPVVADVVRAIARDPAGKEAILGQFDAIQLGAGSPSVDKQGKTLVIRAPTTPVDAFTAQTLRVAIERVL